MGSGAFQVERTPPIELTELVRAACQESAAPVRRGRTVPAAIIIPIAAAPAWYLDKPRGRPYLSGFMRISSSLLTARSIAPCLRPDHVTFFHIPKSVTLPPVTRLPITSPPTVETKARVKSSLRNPLSRAATFIPVVTRSLTIAPLFADQKSEIPERKFCPQDALETRTPFWTVMPEPISYTFPLPVSPYCSDVAELASPIYAAAPSSSEASITSTGAPRSPLASSWAVF